MNIRAFPQVQTDDRNVNQLQKNIQQSLGPVIANPLVSGVILESVSLASGDNTIPHKLGRVLQGWVVVRKRAASEIFDKQDSNPTPEVTLVLNASVAVVVNLYVF